MKLVITKYTGLYFGEVIKTENDSVWLINAKRILYVQEVSGFEDFVNNGTKTPELCKASPIVGEVQLNGVLKIYSISDDALKSISQIPTV